MIFFRVSDRYLKYNYRSQRYVQRNIKDFLRVKNLIADSRYVAEEALEIGFEFMPKVIYPPFSEYLKGGLDRKECRKKLNLPMDKILLLSVASDDPRKNLKAVKETVNQLGTKYALVHVGPKMDGAYNFINISESEINEVYNACDVLLFPSLDEGFGFPLVEAMATGLPVVSSLIDVVSEVCGNAAILVEPEPRKLASGVIDAISNRELYISRGYARSQIFTTERFHSELLNFYKTIR